MLKNDDEHHIVTAQYISVRELQVRVPKGADPRDPSNWIEIESEGETDFYLYDTIDSEEADLGP